MPGYALGGLPGALAVIALFGALLARSTIRFLEDEGIADATTRALFPLIAFGPPIVFYATRIWPEVPAAFCFLEAVRGVRQRRPPRWIAATLRAGAAEDPLRTARRRPARPRAAHETPARHRRRASWPSRSSSRF